MQLALLQRAVRRERIETKKHFREDRNMDLAKLQNGSDVRGVALAGVEGEAVTLDEAAVRAIAGGFARFLRARLGKESCRVSVGRDSRLSG